MFFVPVVMSVGINNRELFRLYVKHEEQFVTIYTINIDSLGISLYLSIAI